MPHLPAGTMPASAKRKYSFLPGWQKTAAAGEMTIPQDRTLLPVRNTLDVANKCVGVDVAIEGVGLKLAVAI